MRQKFLIFAALVVLIGVLIGLNAATYVKQEKTPDSEANPNRSTYNTGATGTRAFYELLAETGRTVTRWQQSPSDLLINDANRPRTFVLVGETRRAYNEKEIEQLLRWVSNGGKLVLIDREPPTELLKTTANWSISAEAAKDPPLLTDPSDIKQMTEKTPAAKPAQPTVYTNKVNAVQASRFASAINFKQFSDGKTQNALPDVPLKSDDAVETSVDDYDAPDAPLSTDKTLDKLKGKDIKKVIVKSASDGAIETLMLPAPVAHLADQNKILLAEFPFGEGRIVYLSDPFIVSNDGINLVDNAQLATNLVAARDGIIAFDEYHQGFGANQNRLLGYFAGTPLASIALQFAALVAVVLFTQSRRFARALPANEANRLSKLEYVAAMAELQQRTRAFDLAMENIYKDFRRRAARLVGADALKTTRADLARMLAERAKANVAEIETLLMKCENIMHGEPSNKKEMLDLTGRLRELEEKLGLKRSNRQTFKK